MPRLQMRGFLAFMMLAGWAGLTGAGVAAEAGGPAAATRPNIILIVTDDQGYGDLGVTGNPVIETPHLDVLARGGASLSNFHVSPVCAPTRASLMTGRYNYRTRVVDTFIGRSMMEPEEVTVAELLRDAGYGTGIFGKWHLGDCYPMRPMDQGFGESLVHRGGGLAQPSEPIDNARRYTDPILIHNGVEAATRGYCTDVYFDAAIQFMEKAHADGRPFFIYLTPNAPHGPFHDVPADLYEKYRQKDLGPVLLGNNRSADTVARIFAMIENIDQNVGRLTRKLDTLGIADNTMVLFMVDNGPDTRRFVGPLRGMKSEVHQGGIRSPFFVRWPARLRAGTTNDRVTAHIDVLPTLLEAAGVQAPDGLKLDGRSFLPLLDGRGADWPDRFLVIQTHRGNVPRARHHFALRTQRWALVRPSGFGREQPPDNVPLELYDLESDPGQSANVADRHPDVLETLTRAYDTWFEDVSRTRPDNFDPPRIVAGTDHETRTVLTWENWRVSDSTGWGRRGQWLLRFARERRYDIEFLWPEPIEPGTLELKVGAVGRMQEVETSTGKVVMKDVLIPAGEAALSATLTSQGRVRDPYQVVLVRR